MISSLPWLLAGGAVAAVNALMRQKTVAALSPQAVRGSLVLAVSGIFFRLGLIAGLLIVALDQGIVPGLLAFAGLWITRGGIVLFIGMGLPEVIEHVFETPND